MASPNDILGASDKKNKHLDAIILAFEQDVNSVMKELYIAVLELVGTLPADASKLVFNQKSLTRVEIIDKLINEVNKKLKGTVFVNLAVDMAKSAQFSKDMYMAAGYSDAALAKVDTAINLISRKLGITSTGQVITGGFLDTIANSNILKLELKNIVINGISSKLSITELNKLMKEAILGTATKDSKLMRYFKLYIHDSVYKTSRAYDKVIADELGVKNFLYANDIIKTSRDFCMSRAYKIFSRTEINSWKELKYPYFPEPYDPFIDCGGYNCRHWLIPASNDEGEIKGINEAADKWRKESLEELK